MTEVARQDAEPGAGASPGASTRILVAGGGTAGHVFPAIAVARELQRIDQRVEPVFVGTRDRLEGWLVPAAGFPLYAVDALPLPRRLSFGLLRVPSALRAAVEQCSHVVREVSAEIAVTFGGYVSFPVDRACARLGVPLVIHEQNSVPGLANRFAARWADRVCVSFPGSLDRFGRQVRTVLTGNPVREEILQVDRAAQRDAAARHFGLEPDRRTVLVFGGSQGARSINRAVVDSYRWWSRPDEVQILHAAGQNLHSEAAAAWEEVRGGPGGALVRCVDFIDDMSRAYAVADMVVCRAGATSIAELTALGIPAVLIPYPHATRDHQMHNAVALRQAGAARVIPDGQVDGRALVQAVEPVLLDDEALARARRASRGFGRRDAARTVATLVLDLLASRREVDRT